jgi:hypothetical protein
LILFLCKIGSEISPVWIGIQISPARVLCIHSKIETSSNKGIRIRK